MRGIVPTVTKTIAVFSTITKEWKKIGEFNYARCGHGVFIQQDAFVLVGGTDYRLGRTKNSVQKKRFSFHEI